MPHIRGKKRRKTTVVGTAFIHPDLTVTLKHLRINRFQATGADAGSVLDLSAPAIRIAHLCN
jgi:hypothetical protein